MKNKKSPFILAILLFLLLTGCARFDAEQARKNLDDRKSVIEALKLRFDDSVMTVELRRNDFWSHHITDNDIDGRISRARVALLELTYEGGWLDQMASAIEKKDRKKAEQALENIDSRIEIVNSGVNYILGPPGIPGQGFFAGLDSKVALFESGYDPNDGNNLYQEVKDLDAPSMALIRAASPFNLCGSQAKMTFMEAYATHDSGQRMLEEVEKLLVGEGDKDLPVISDSLVQIKSEFSDAIAVSTSTQHDTAFAGIREAEGARGEADDSRFWRPLAHYREESDDAYKDGEENLVDAYDECKIEDFASSLVFANDARDFFKEAQYQVERAKPEPVVIIVESEEEETTTQPVFEPSITIDTDEVEAPTDNYTEPVFEIETDDYTQETYEVPSDNYFEPEVEVESDNYFE